MFLLGGGFTTEKGKKSTLNFLQTQPIPQKKLFLGKLFNAKVVATLSYIAIFILIIMVATVFNRFGDWQYPVFNI